MKVTKVSVTVVNLRLKEPYVMANSWVDTVSTPIIQIWTDNGHMGIGSVGGRAEGKSGEGGGGYNHENIEAKKIMAEKYYGPALIGADPLDINDWTERIDRAWKRGYTYTKAGFEIALYDLIGKEMRRPVSDVLGGTWHKEVALIAGISVGGPAGT